MDIDIEYGSQMGFQPDLTEWIRNEGCVQKNLIPVLIVGFGPKVPQYELQTKMLRAIIELHAVKIDGFRRSFYYDAKCNVVMKEHPGMPKFTYGEKYGRPIDHFHLTWMHDWLAKATAIDREDAKVTVLFFEPNSTHDDIVEAYLCENMYPRLLSGLSPRRDITASPQAQVYVEYHAETRQSESINAFAKEILKKLTTETLDPSVTSVAAEILKKE